MPILMDSNLLHYIVHPIGTLDAVYDEHGRRATALEKTLCALNVSEADLTTLRELEWLYMADRVARERVRAGRPIHHRSVLLDIFAACEDDSGEIHQSERNLAYALQAQGVKLVVILALVANQNCIYLLADRLALELEKRGFKAEYQTASQARYAELAALKPTSDPHAS